MTHGFLFKLFFIQYIFIIFFLPQTPLRSFPTSVPTQLHVFSLFLSFFQKEKKRKLNKPLKSRATNTNKTKISHIQNIPELPFSWPTILDMESALEGGWYVQWYFIGKNYFCFYQQVSIANSFLVGGWDLCPLLCLILGPVWLEPVQVFCVLPQSLWVLMCISPVVSGVIYHLLQTSVSFPT